MPTCISARFAQVRICFIAFHYDYIVTFWKVVFANESGKLGWIWMKLGRWGWGLKRLSRARFQQNRAMGFGESAKKWVAEACFFVKCTTHHFCHFPLIDSAKLPRNTCPRAGLRHMVSHSRKVSIEGSNFPKNPLFRIQKGILFVLSLRVTGNVQRRLDCLHHRVDIPQMCLS